MGLMDLLKTSDPMEKFYAAAEKSNVPQGGLTGAAFKSMFPYGLGNKAFGREPEPMPDMASPQGTQVMAELVQNVVGPGTFIGPKGLARLFGDDAAKGVLATAESKLAQGVPRESVFQELGVFKGPEGKWRYEIDDSRAKIEMRPDGSALPAKKAIEHQDLFGAYPDASKIKVSYQNLGSDSGRYSGQSPYTGTEDIFVNPLRANEDTLLHELQHAVQGREGFAAGGSPNQFSGAGEMVNNISGDMKIAPDVVEFWRRVDSGIPRKQAGEGLDRNAVINALGFSDSLEARAWADGLENQMNEWSDIAIDPFSAYQRLAGEAESRAVQDRAGMNMKERRSIFPEYATRNDLIIRGLMSP